MISLENGKISTLLQKLPKNVGNSGKIIVATGFKYCPKCNKSPNVVTLVLSQLAGRTRYFLPKFESRDCREI